MVLFENIYINQKVERYRRDGSIENGIVRYKGPVVGRKGEWVGLEVLEHNQGYGDGMILGRRYFQCKDGYGVFTRASMLNLISNTKRRLYNFYRSMSVEDERNENLFENEIPDVVDPRQVPLRVSRELIYRSKESTRGSYRPSEIGGLFEKPRSYHLSHSVGSKLQAATMKRPESARKAVGTHSMNFGHSLSPLHVEYSASALPDHMIRRVPSIPKCHMPHSVLRKQVREGWHDSHYVREMTVATGRDSMKFSAWNDISP